MLDPEKTSDREVRLALRELDAQIAGNEKFQREFEIKLLTRQIKLDLQELLDREWRQKR
jgi:hypothetical protein